MLKSQHAFTFVYVKMGRIWMQGIWQIILTIFSLDVYRIVYCTRMIKLKWTPLQNISLYLDLGFYSLLLCRGIQLLFLTMNLTSNRQ